MGFQMLGLLVFHIRKGLFWGVEAATHSFGCKSGGFVSCFSLSLLVSFGPFFILCVYLEEFHKRNLCSVGSVGVA